MIKSEHERIYERTDWRERRLTENAWHDWYSGKTLAEAEDITVDPQTGERAKLYPLRINPIAKVCRVHRSVLFGMPNSYDTPLVQMIVKPAGDQDADRNVAKEAQELLRRTLVGSDASSLFNEAGLLTQVHGGHVIQVVWDEQDFLAPYRIRLVSHPSPHFYPVYDPRNFWNLREAYIGYMISAEDALKIYGINTHGKDEVLYMEEWTPDEYVITVNGIVPSLEGYGRLEGKHAWGRVPIIYIPHYRDGSFYGRSQVEEIIDLTVEKNSRSADRGDLVNDYAHPTLVGKNISRGTEMMPVETDENGRVTRRAIHLGTEPATPNAPKKELGYITPPPVPPEVLEYDAELWAEIRRQSDIASVAMGDDDVSGGRITGPVTAYRMWPTMAHTQAERIEFATGLRNLADIIFRIARQKSAENVQQRRKIELPKGVDGFVGLETSTVWNPQIPIEVTERAAMLNARLQAGGISLYEYLVEMGEQDIEAEIERIQADRKQAADLEIEKAKASRPPTPPQSGQKPSTSGSKSQ